MNYESTTLQVYYQAHASTSIEVRGVFYSVLSRPRHRSPHARRSGYGAPAVLEEEASQLDRALLTLTPKITTRGSYSTTKIYVSPKFQRPGACHTSTFQEMLNGVYKIGLGGMYTSANSRNARRHQWPQIYVFHNSVFLSIHLRHP